MKSLLSHGVLAALLLIPSLGFGQNGVVTDPYTPSWVICLEAPMNRADAVKYAHVWSEQRHFQSGVLWIPDYSSLSGAQRWLVFLGPFDSKESANFTLSHAKKYMPNAYVKQLSGPRHGGGGNSSSGYSNNSGGSSSGHVSEFPAPAWVIALEAPKTEAGAQKAANKWQDKGYPANYLWIPDWGSLSGAQRYLVYLGPYALSEKGIAQQELRRVKKHYKSAYGILVDNQGPRQTFSK